MITNLCLLGCPIINWVDKLIAQNGTFVIVYPWPSTASKFFAPYFLIFELHIFAYQNFIIRLLIFDIYLCLLMSKTRNLAQFLFVSYHFDYVVVPIVISIFHEKHCMSRTFNLDGYIFTPTRREGYSYHKALSAVHCKINAKLWIAAPPSVSKRTSQKAVINISDTVT